MKVVAITEILEASIQALEDGIGVTLHVARPAAIRDLQEGESLPAGMAPVCLKHGRVFLDLDTTGMTNQDIGGHLLNELGLVEYHCAAGILRYYSKRWLVIQLGSQIRGGWRPIFSIKPRIEVTAARINNGAAVWAGCVTVDGQPYQFLAGGRGGLTAVPVVDIRAGQPTETFHAIFESGLRAELDHMTMFAALTKILTNHYKLGEK